MDREIRTKIPLERYQINAWIEDGQLKLKPIERQPTPEEKRDPKYCMFHRTIGHSTPGCYSVRRLYYSKVQKREIVQAVEKNPLPSHKLVLTCTAVEENSEPIVVIESMECSKESTQKEGLVDGLAKSRVESLEFGEQAQKEATKAILDVFEKFGEKCCVISEAVGKIARQNLDTLTFSRKDAKQLAWVIISHCM